MTTENDQAHTLKEHQDDNIIINNSNINNQLYDDNTHQDNDDGVILIESDEEEEKRIFEENRTRRLVPDGRVGRPRDNMNRFVSNSNNTTNSRNPTSSSIENTSENMDIYGDGAEIITGNNNISDSNTLDDDITITGAVERIVDPEGPIDENAEFIDLVRDPEYSSEINPRLVVISGDNSRRNSNNTNSNNLYSADEEDDGLIITEERTTRPRVTLNLPGGETLEINASETDQPQRTSFEWQHVIPASRRQLLRRSANRANSLFMTADEDDDEHQDNSTNIHLPQRIMRLRSREAMRLRDLEMRRRRARQIESRLPNSPEFEMIRTRIQSYPPNVRSCFEHAQTLHEFRSLLQNSDPLILRECGTELVRLFTDYRSFLMQNWAQNRIQAVQDRSIRGRGPGWRRGRDGRNDLIRIGMGDTSILTPEINGFAAAAHDHFLGYDDYAAVEEEYGGGDGNADDERTQNIINMIQEREERERDSRTKNFMAKSKPLQDSIIQKAQALPNGYSSNFETVPKTKLNIVKNGVEETIFVEDDDISEKYEDVPACTLCGVELGVGIPDDYDCIVSEDRGSSFEALKSKYKFHCPYQTLARPSQLDRDLSKRTFIALCGHTYCGRCVARIDNARSRKLSKRKLAELTGPSHPDNYGPRVCPAEGCRALVRARGKIKEIYF